MVRRESSMASATPFRSPRISVMSPASIATSVPDAHGDSQVGLRQRGRVVDAVAHHGHALARRLAASSTSATLLVGQHLGEHVLDAGLARDRFGGRAAGRR